MSMIGVFCRSNHPAGYGGFPDNPGDAPPALRREGPQQFSGAHGYVTLLVDCASTTELNAVTERLRKWFEWPNRGDLWYSGTFDFVASVTPHIPCALIVGGTYKRYTTPEWVSLGDNRAVAWLSAEDVLK